MIPKATGGLSGTALKEEMDTLSQDEVGVSSQGRKQPPLLGRKWSEEKEVTGKYGSLVLQLNIPSLWCPGAQRGGEAVGKEGEGTWGTPRVTGPNGHPSGATALWGLRGADMV